MALKKSTPATGRVNTENISGGAVPRKPGLDNQTTGKMLGSRDVRNIGGPRFNYVRSGG